MRRGRDRPLMSSRRSSARYGGSVPPNLLALANTESHGHHLEYRRKHHLVVHPAPVTFPGEMFHAIGQRVKACCPAPNSYLMGYTNGYIGYFPAQQAFAEGGYEPAVSHLDPASESIYFRQLSDLLKRFH